MREHQINIKKKKSIIDSYNASFEYYDNRYESLQFQKYGHAFIGANFRSKLILDAGCGTGLFFTYFSKYLSKSKNLRSNFIYLDISLNMLKEIKIKEELQEEKAPINLVLSDMENLPFRDKLFDLIVSITSLQNLPDIFQGVSELIRISKQGTHFYLSILKKDTRLNKLVSKFKPYFDDFMAFYIEDLEDIIIQGKLRGKN